MDRKRIGVMLICSLLACSLLVVGCGNDDSSTSVDAESSVPAEESANDMPSTEQDGLDIAVGPRETWVTMEDYGGIKVLDNEADEWVKPNEIVPVHEFFEVSEYVYEDYRTSDFPSGLHVAIWSGDETMESDIDDPDVINDFWYRIMRMRVLPELSKEDEGGHRVDTFSFTWDDGRTQTYIFKSTNLLLRDGKLYLLAETDYTNGEVFIGPTVQRAKNPFYPGLLHDIAQMLIEDQLGLRKVFLVKTSSGDVSYEEESFYWDSGRGTGADTYIVSIEGETDTEILISDAWDQERQCRIEGASRLYTILKLKDDEGPYLDIAYQPSSDSQAAPQHCTIRSLGDELVVR